MCSANAIARNRALLVEAGEFIFGLDWQSPLARKLGVTARTMRYWVADTHPVPAHIIARLPDFMRAEAAERRHVADNLDTFADELEASLAA